MPDRERAVVEDSKIRNYLLSTEHPDGRSKALFFFSLGFQPNDTTMLRDALLAHATMHQVAKEVRTIFGTKYIIEGTIKSPRQITATIRTVWIVTFETKLPKLVTAYPIQL